MKKSALVACTAAVLATITGISVAAFATPAGTVDYVNVNSVNGVTVQAQGRDLQSPTAGQSILFGAKLVAVSSRTLSNLVFAARDSSGNNLDFGHQVNYSLSTTTKTFTASRTFPQGTYTVWVAFNQGGTWYDLTPQMTVTVGAAPPTNPPPTGQEQPVGAGTGWTREFTDDFGTLSLDTNGGGSARWYARNCSAEADCSSSAGTGNKGNQQLEFDRASNCSVSNGILDIKAERTNVSTPSGGTYNWTSCMLTTNESFQYGFMEARMDLPSDRGFWPAFWTWQAPGVNVWNETDVFEYYSDNHTKLYMSQHAQGGFGCQYTPPFDPSDGFHVYGANIQPSGTTFYVDGVVVCSTTKTSVAQSQMILDTFVYSTIPPLSSTNIEHTLVDYVRAWS